MKAVFEIDAAMKSEIEQFVKTDEKINRGSITFKDGSLFGDSGKVYLIYDGSEECIKRISEKATRSRKEEEILKKVEEEEESAAHGFGSLFS